jgi:hypothetical protein
MPPSVSSLTSASFIYRNQRHIRKARALDPLRSITCSKVKNVRLGRSEEMIESPPKDFLNHKQFELPIDGQ